MDLDGLFKRAFDGFGGDPGPAGFPGVPGSAGVAGNDQTIVNNDISRCSRFSRSEKRDLDSDQNPSSKNASNFFSDDRAREDPFKSPGDTGTPGNEAKTLAESTSLQFPVKDREPGTPGTEKTGLHAPILDLNAAAPQRSDWWSGSAMAEADRLAAPAGGHLPITPAEVRAGVAREMRALADFGVAGPEAERRAVEITAAKIRNSSALAERQAHAGRCHVCGEPLDGARAEVAVLNPGGSALHLHGGECHAKHSARKAALVDRIMAAAGYGAQAEGEAA